MQDGADRQRADDLRVGPAELVAVDDAPDEGEQAGADEAEPDEVERAVGPVRLRRGGRRRGRSRRCRSAR